MMVTKLRELPAGFVYRLDLARAATPRELRDAPRHRWFYFPHSYSPRLVHEVLNHWHVPSGSLLLDPFVGAGTTLLVGRERGMNAIGFDLSPLAALVSRVKIRNHILSEIREALEAVLCHAADGRTPNWDSERLRKAFSASELSRFGALAHAIQSQPAEIRDFLMVALLSITRSFSRAVADGGWFRWRDSPDQSDKVFAAFENQTVLMLEDLVASRSVGEPETLDVGIGDARALNVTSDSVDAIVTSPPYPNRHDYTRVFHIELLLLGMSEREIIELRHTPVRSHVEAKAGDFTSKLSGYTIPNPLEAALQSLPRDSDPRVWQMLKGYFEDMYLSLVEAHRVLKAGGKAALVVGNVRHAGVLIPVDEVLGVLGEQAGFSHEKTWVIRLRGNSAQQMGRFGREASRESVVLLRKV